MRDPRYMQSAILFIYAFAAREFFYLERNHFIVVLCVGWAVLFDLALGIGYFKKIVFPLSAIIIGLSSSILIDATHWIYYPLIVTIAILSKAFLTYRGRHMFNPTNLAVVIGLQLLPHQISAIPNLFAGYLWPSVIFAVLGVAMTVYARQADVSFSWVLSFIAFAIVRATLFSRSPWFAVGPAMSSSFLLFSFHMINDPSTTPRQPGNRILFGVSVAALDAILRFKQVPFGQFYALAVVCAFLPFIRNRETASAPNPRLIRNPSPA